MDVSRQVISLPNTRPLVSVTFLAGHGEICPCIAARRPAHNTPIHMDLVPFLKKTIQEIHVDQRVVRWSAGRHVDHPCGGQISPWTARKDTNCSTLLLEPLSPRKK